MWNIHNNFYYFLFALILYVKASDNNLSYYTAGVVEYGSNLLKEENKEILKTADQFILNNLNEYVQFIRKAKENNVDILVFPEATFNYVESRELMIKHSIELPNPQDQIAPYQYPDKYSDILRNLSQECKNHEIYVLVNLIEKVHCDNGGSSSGNQNTEIPCKRNDSYNIYNTNVVFDRQGRVISKYQKYNLYMEPNVEAADSVQYSTFTTDFHVKFGHFICFDILFEKPAVELVKIHNVSNILYPSMWFSDIPFLTSLQIHSGWAYTNDINFLSAGASYPTVGSGGSGIFIGRHSVQHKIIEPTITQQLLIAKVPKNPKIYHSQNNNNLSLLKMYKNNNAILNNRNLHPHGSFTPAEMEKFNIEEIWSTFGDIKYNMQNNQKHTICTDHNELCCTFHIKYKNLENISNQKFGYQYKLVVNSTTRPYGKERSGGEIYCGIVACTNQTSESCGKRFKNYDNYENEIEFESISIIANIKLQNQLMMMPSTLTTQILPLETNQYDFNDDDNQESDTKIERQYSMKSNGNLQNLLTFCIFGRNFDADKYFVAS